MTADENFRKRFAEELDKNFSVIAPAGVGKTTSIVNRVIYLATQNESLLPSLVVVTYTNKAAKEMQQRARSKIIAANVPPSVVSHFNRAFFGTIHSFCLKLLRQYGHYLGLPSQLELLEDDEQIFFSQKLKIPENADVLKYVSVFDILKLAKQLHVCVNLSPSTRLPQLNFDPIFDCPLPNHSKAKPNVIRGQQIAQAWLQRKGFNPIPEFEKGGAEFQCRWQESFKPMREWIARESLFLAARMAHEFRSWRFARGRLTYQDQIELAAELLQHSVAGKLIREQNFLVILDEAQDTDPDQFRVLLEVARPAHANGDWLHTKKDSPRAGAFCMVGDPQQSIYGDRADLAFYQNVHKQLLASGAEELTFHVTFRCDESIIQNINCLGPALLDGQNGQADYVELAPRGNAAQGQALRLKIPAWPQTKKSGDFILANHEAKFLADWISRVGLEGLQARAWSEVAILCPRKRWLDVLADALRKKNFDAQIQSHRETMGDSPFYLWVAALSVVMSQPRNAFEIVGVLREIFGLSDASLAEFCDKNSSKFQIETPTEGENPVAKKLAELHELRNQILHLSLRDAVEQLCILVHQHLAAIEGFSFENESFLLARAADAEANGATLSEWTEKLLRGLDDARPEEEPRKNALQLITCQKAKGLEWDAVIIPFFSRKIYYAALSYPRFIRQVSGEIPELFITSGDLNGEKDSAIKLRTQQELQRLLYVSLTRARRTLIAVDDSEIFKDKNGKPFSSSFAFHLSLDSFSEKISPLKVADEKQIVQLAPETPLTEKEWIFAKRFYFAKRILPHTLTKKSAPFGAEEPEQRLLVLPQETERLFATERVSALDYGIWWHHLCETMPWNFSQNWQAHFENFLVRSPLPDRAQKEWQLFLQSELAKTLHEKNLIIHTEMPVFHPLASGECVEGVIDLAVYDTKNKSWLVIDWKTDETKDISHLLETYTLQLQAYCNALEILTSQKTSAGIYSTSLGVFSTSFLS